MVSELLHHLQTELDSAEADAGGRALAERLAADVAEVRRRLAG